MNEIMTLNEVADYLKIASKTVSRMIQRDEIPCFKISGQWRFKKSVIDNWLDMKMNTTTSKINSSYSKDDISFMPLYKLINEDFIVLDIKDGDREEILRQLSKPLIVNNILENTDELVLNLLKRENMASTSISKRVAFPHCRKPEDNNHTFPPIILGVSKNGVSFDLTKENKTNLFFLILVNDEIIHLRILSKLAKFIKRENIIERITNVKNQKEIINILMESEYEHMA